MSIEETFSNDTCNNDKDAAILDDAKRMLAILDERIERHQVLSGTYVNGVAEMVKILWNCRF